MGYVYLIGNKSLNWYKIGFSKRVEDNFGLSENAVPFVIEIVHVWETKIPRSLEQTLHEQVTDKRPPAEWFRLSERDILECDRYAKHFLAEKPPLGERLFVAITQRQRKVGVYVRESKTRRYRRAQLSTTYPLGTIFYLRYQLEAKRKPYQLPVGTTSSKESKR